jgi:hypothetical protein
VAQTTRTGFGFLLSCMGLSGLGQCMIKNKQKQNKDPVSVGLKMQNQFHHRGLEYSIELNGVPSVSQIFTGLCMNHNHVSYNLF